MAEQEKKMHLDATDRREIFTLSIRDYVTHYQVRKGLLLAIIVLFAMFIGLMILRLPVRAALAAAGIMIATILLALYPYLGLFAQVWMYFRPFPVWGGPEFLRPIFLITIITFLLFVLNFVFMKKRKIKFPRECSLAILLLAFMVISSLSAVYSSSISFSQNFIFFKIVVFYFLVINLVTSEKELNIFIWFIIFCATLASLETIRYYRYYGAARIDSVGGVHREANFLASILILILPLVFQRIYSRSRIQKMIAIVLVPIFITAVVLTGSRGGTIGLLGVMLLLCWRFRRKRLTPIMIGLIVFSTVVISPGHYWNRIKTIVNYQEEKTAQSRIELWKAGLHMYVDHPLAGVGQGNFVWISPEYIQYRTWTGQGYVAHNIFIQLLAEGGIQTLVAFVAFVGWTFRQLWRTRRRVLLSPDLQNLHDISIAVEISLMGFLICGLFLSIGNVDVFYWILALGPVVSILTEQAERRTSPMNSPLSTREISTSPR